MIETFYGSENGVLTMSQNLTGPVFYVVQS